MSLRTLTRRAADDRGDIDDVPAWTLMALVAIVMISTIFLFARAAAATNSVQAAAYAAARDASLSRAADAVPHAITAARQALDGDVNCTDLNVTIGGNGLHTGLGQAGVVSATVSCTISYTDLILPGLHGLPGAFTVTKTAHSPVDPYRQR